MSVFTGDVLAKDLTAVLGIGAGTLNPDGSVASITGVTIRRVTAAPTQADNAGSLALRTNGSVYVTTGGGTWFPIGGGAGTGWQLPDDVVGTWGTNAPGQVYSVYDSGSNRWDLAGDSISQATAASGAGLRISTGSNTITGAAAGNASANIAIQTGTTDCTNAGGTAGASGTLALSTGNATSTAGVSGASGAITVTTGGSDDANSGGISLSTGNAASGTSGSIVFTPGTSNSAGTVQSVGRLTTTDGVSGGTVRVVGGRAYSTTADSGVITGNGSAQAFNQSYLLPGSTMKAGSVLRASGCVRRTGINGADSAVVTVRFGGTTYLTSAIVVALAGERCYFDLQVITRAAPGAGVTVVGAGSIGWNTAGASMVASGNSTALATDINITVDVLITMANNAGNTAVLEQFQVSVT